MGQGYSLTTLSAGSAGIDVPELADLVYEKSLGTARFMKSIRARQRNGLVFVKVIMKPYPSMDLGPYVKAIHRERKVLEDVPNALEYQRILETGTCGYLIRQYIHSSLYDRISTRPFLEEIEKKWISFQLLCALRDCHAQEVFHGDLKTENILVTSWNWLFLSDFSSSFKPTFLPVDNPADFFFYFDTSGRGTCYVAPERFLGTGENPGNRGMNWAMDIFSAGCVIAELFLESPIFSLSQLFKYRKGEYSPEHSHISKIDDPDIRELVLHMIQLDPESRYSAEEYLNFWRHKAFPEYFYSFLHQYMGLITDPAAGNVNIDAELDRFGEADDRIERVHLDFDKISYFLGANIKKAANGSQITTPKLSTSDLPVQLDLPNYRQTALKSQTSADNGTLIFLTLVVSSIRSTAHASARAKACDILLAFAERLSDEAKLDRILPYVVILLNDRADPVKVAGLRTLAQLLSMVRVVSPVNAYVFPEYIFPRLQSFVSGSGSGPSPIVRAAYASCIASLAQSSIRILDMIQSLRSDARMPALMPNGSGADWSEGVTYHNLFDVARVDLLDYFEAHTKALITDSDPSVRRAFLGSVSSLCVFFGNVKANDVILSHLNTYLNDKDWILKCAFLEAVVGVATYVGTTSLEEFILPLMVQSLTDTEEFVVERVLRSLSSMADLGLFQRSTTWDLLNIAVRFFVHPDRWIREASVQLSVALTKFLSPADKYCIFMPLTQPYLKTDIAEVSESQILDSLKKPLSKTLYDMTIMWASKAEKGIFWKSSSRDGSLNLSNPESSNIPKTPPKSKTSPLNTIPRNEEDEQWLSRLRNLGMTAEDEFKFVALKEYIWRVSNRQAKEAAKTTVSPLNTEVTVTQFNIHPRTVFYDRKQGPKYQRTLPKARGIQSIPGEGKAHTIADALLDASTTIDNGAGARRKNARSRNQRHAGLDTPISRQSTLEPIGNDSSQAPSPVSSSPGVQVSSHGASPLSSDAERRQSRLTPGGEDSGSSTPTESGRPFMKNLAVGVHRKPSAVSLLKKDSSKAYAETGTTSTNAFGKVDAPVNREASPQSALAMAKGTVPQEQHPVQYHANHTYNGNDPTILNLLDTVFAENYPTDLFDLGPVVNPVLPRQPIKKVTGQDPDKPWRPEGNLVAMFGEHSGPINRVAVAPDHAFFVTASDDGTVRVWDTTRLEKNLTPKSRQTHSHGAANKVKSITFVESTHTFISAATDGSIHAVKVDYWKVNDTVRYGKLQLVRQYQLPATGDSSEYAVWMEHYRSDTHSLLLIATNTSRIIALDLKTMLVVYTIQNPVHHGTPTTFCLDRRRHWLLLGTSHGILDLWDLRFRVRLRAWGLPGGTAIHRLQVHPLKGRGRWVCVVGGSSYGGEITVWDIEKVQCREVYRAVTGPEREPSNGGAARNRKSTVAAADILKNYKPWRVDEDRREGMLGRFGMSTGAAGIEPTATSGAKTGSGNNGEYGSSQGDPNAVRALAVGLDMPEDGKEGSKCGFLVSAGSDRKIRFWDLTRPEASTVISGADSVGDAGTGKPRYDTSHPTPSLAMTTEWMPSLGGGGGKSAAGAAGKKGSGSSGGRPPRNTLISLQQQQLLKNHLDSILDVAVLEVPYGMTVSVDRGGMVYVFQ